MNQILEEVTKTEQDSTSVTTILADTNVVLKMGQAIDALNKNGWKIAVTRSILRELKKKDQGLYLYACANFEVINDSTEKIALEASYIFTHQPDNLLIAAAKVGGFPLISYDMALLKVAVYQGVEACIPELFIKQKGILDSARGVHKAISQTTCTNVISRDSDNIDERARAKNCHELVLAETQAKEDGEVIRTYRSLGGVSC